MRFSLLLALFLSCSLLHAQKAGWNRVEALSPGTHLLVTTQRRTLHCPLSDTNDEGLYCDSLVGPLLIPRSHIMKIRVSRPEKAALLGTVLGASVGGVAYGTANTGDAANAKVVPVVVGAAIGGFGDYLIGRIVGRATGHTIYIRP